MKVSTLLLVNGISIQNLVLKKQKPFKYAEKSGTSHLALSRDHCLGSGSLRCVLVMLFLDHFPYDWLCVAATMAVSKQYQWVN